MASFNYGHLRDVDKLDEKGHHIGPSVPSATESPGYKCDWPDCDRQYTRDTYLDKHVQIHASIALWKLNGAHQQTTLEADPSLRSIRASIVEPRLGVGFAASLPDPSEPSDVQYLMDFWGEVLQALALAAGRQGPAVSLATATYRSDILEALKTATRIDPTQGLSSDAESPGRLLEKRQRVDLPESPPESSSRGRKLESIAVGAVSLKTRGKVALVFWSLEEAALRRR